MRFIRIFGLWLVVAVFTLSPLVARAELSIAVLDVQKLLTESDAAKSIQQQIHNYREGFLDKLSKHEQELRKTEKELIDEKASLSSEEFAKKKNAFEEKFLETRKLAQQQKRNLDEAAVKAMAELEAEMYKVVQDIVDEEEYTLVISRQNVVLGEKSLDISDVAMKRLNKSASNITLKVPSK